MELTGELVTIIIGLIALLITIISIAIKLERRLTKIESKVDKLDGFYTTVVNTALSELLSRNKDKAKIREVRKK
jgi:hypothetical protein